MSEDEAPRRGGVPAPWERRWSPSPPSAGAAPADDGVDPSAAEDGTPGARRALDDPTDPGDKLSVADLIDKVGGPTAPRRRRRRRVPEDDAATTAGSATDAQPADPVPPAPPGPASGAPTAAGTDRDRPGSAVDDTAVLPRYVEEHAPLGGASPPPPTRATAVPARPRVPRPVPVPVRTTPSEEDLEPAEHAQVRSLPAAVPTRLQDKKSRRQRRAVLLSRVAVGAVAVLVLGITGAAWTGLRYVDSNQRQVVALDPGSTAIQQPEQQLGDENFLLIGSDTRAGESGEIGAGDESEVGGARSDTTMIAHIPADRSRVVIVSFPRDLEVDIPSCQRWDNDTASYTAEEIPPQYGVKLNQAYFEGGPACITKVVQQLSGLSVNHFLGVDFAGFQSMVDAVGGVEVCTERPLDDANLGLILPEAGTQRINGQQALNYVRARYVAGDPTSDYGRIQRQQRFLSSLLRASLSQDTLLDFGKLKNLVDAVTASTFGENVGVDQLLTLAESLGGIEAGRVTFVTSPTTGEANSAGNEVLLEDANSALFQAIRENAPLPGEAAAPVPSTTAAPTTPAAPPAVLAVDPASVELVVRNATGTSGLASLVADELAGVGFAVSDTDNFPDPAEGVVVRYAAAGEAAARTVASALPGATLELDETLGTGVELVLGEDPTGTVTAPTAAGTALAAPPAAAGPPTTPGPLPEDLAVVNAGDVTCG